GLRPMRSCRSVLASTMLGKAPLDKRARRSKRLQKDRAMTTPIGAFHEGVILHRRVQVLARWVSDLVQGERTLLDIGCGDGSIDLLVQQANPSLSVRGVDVLVRPAAKIPVDRFDGCRLPFDDKSFDAVMCIDVLHHTEDPTILMREAKR